VVVGAGGRGGGRGGIREHMDKVNRRRRGWRREKSIKRKTKRGGGGEP